MASTEEGDFLINKGYPKNKAAKKTEGKKTMREFDTGAFRDTDGDKLQFTKALSPIVLIRYVEFMHQHNQTAAGQRSEDNWKQGFTRKSYMESKFRHLIETWLIQDGLKEHLDPKLLENIADIEDLELEELIESLCAEFFNTQGFIHVLLLEQRERRRANKKPGLSRELTEALKKKFVVKKSIKAIRKKVKRKKKDAVHYRPGTNKSICGLKSIGTSTWSWTVNISEVTCKTCKKSINATKL